MIISNSTLDGLRTTFSLAFWDAYKATDVWGPKLATEVPSNSKSNTYGWLAQSVTLREWVGTRVAANLSEHAYQVTNKTFERAIEVKREDIEDDNLGMYQSMLIPQLAQASKKHQDQLLTALLQSSTVGFDGKAWFATNHPTFKGSGTYSNYSSTGMALTADNFNTVWSTMAAYTGEDGQPLMVMPQTLFVPPQLKKVALQIMQSTTAAVPVTNKAGSENVGGASIDNVLKGWADVVVLPELAGEPTTWYLADTSKAIKPCVYQMRRAPQFVSKTAPDDPTVFDRNVFSFGVDYRSQVGITLPFLIYKAVA